MISVPSAFFSFSIKVTEMPLNVPATPDLLLGQRDKNAVVLLTTLPLFSCNSPGKGGGCSLGREQLISLNLYFLLFSDISILLLTMKGRGLTSAPKGESPRVTKKSA